MKIFERALFLLDLAIDNLTFINLVACLICHILYFITVLQWNDDDYSFCLSPKTSSSKKV